MRSTCTVAAGPTANGSTWNRWRTTSTMRTPSSRWPADKATRPGGSQFFYDTTCSTSLRAALRSRRDRDQQSRVHRDRPQDRGRCRACPAGRAGAGLGAEHQRPLRLDHLALSGMAGTPLGELMSHARCARLAPKKERGFAAHSTGMLFRRLRRHSPEAYPPSPLEAHEASKRNPTRKPSPLEALPSFDVAALGLRIFGLALPLSKLESFQSV